MSKIPLLLLPGFLCDGTVWEAQTHDLGDIADPTILDWGTLDSLADMAERVLQTAPRTFALAGHSMGGRIAFEVYRRAPERVSHLALLDTNYPPKAAGEAGDAEVRGRHELLAIARAQGIRAMANRWLDGMIPPFRRQDATLVESIITMFERKTADDFARQMKALIERPDAGPVLAQIRCRALVLTGENDLWSPPAAHERMHYAIAGSRLVIVPACGHMSTMERPAAISLAFRDWLAIS